MTNPQITMNGYFQLAPVILIVANWEALWVPLSIWDNPNDRRGIYCVKAFVDCRAEIGIIAPPTAIVIVL